MMGILPMFTQTQATGSLSKDILFVQEDVLRRRARELAPQLESFIRKLAPKKLKEMSKEDGQSLVDMLSLVRPHYCASLAEWLERQLIGHARS